MQTLSISVSVSLLLLLVVQLGFADWSGSFAPSGRYMLVFIFALAFVIAKYLDPKNKLETVLVALGIILSFAVSVGFIYRINIYREMSFVYLGPAEDSIITQKIAFLRSFPLFNPISKLSDQRSLNNGGLLLVFVVLFNAGLTYLITKKNKHTPRKHSVS